MYFPFLTAEVNCGNEALNIADRLNAHSAAVAANAVVELYRLVSREDELDRRILTSSISHDNEAVRIKNGSEKRTPYTFTRNVYEMFYPIHHKRLCSAIDQLPNPEDFDVESFSRPSDLGPLEQKDSQLTTSYSQQTEQEFPSSQTSEPVFKKPKGKGKK